MTAQPAFLVGLRIGVINGVIKCLYFIDIYLRRDRGGLFSAHNIHAHRFSYGFYCALGVTGF